VGGGEVNKRVGSRRGQFRFTNSVSGIQSSCAYMHCDRSSDERPAHSFAVSLVNEQIQHPVNARQLIDAAKQVLRESDFTSANVSLAVVDDPTIHELNRRYLNHDYPTDVLSFALDECNGHLEGEVILSADTAAAQSAEVGWPASAEQLLYVIHGTLHLIGYGDESPEEVSAMRAAEERHLREFDLQLAHPSRSSEADNRSVRYAGRKGGRSES
jgi:probable rRNA maturation factor